VTLVQLAFEPRTLTLRSTKERDIRSGLGPERDLKGRHVAGHGLFLSTTMTRSVAQKGPPGGGSRKDKGGRAPRIKCKPQVLILRRSARALT
jgi:hypothetical protein